MFILQLCDLMSKNSKLIKSNSSLLSKFLSTVSQAAFCISVGYANAHHDNVLTPPKMANKASYGSLCGGGPPVICQCSRSLHETSVCEQFGNETHCTLPSVTSAKFAI